MVKKSTPKKKTSKKTFKKDIIKGYILGRVDYGFKQPELQTSVVYSNAEDLLNDCEDVDIEYYDTIFELTPVFTISKSSIKITPYNG